MDEVNTKLLYNIKLVVFVPDKADASSFLSQRVQSNFHNMLKLLITFSLSAYIY